MIEIKRDTYLQQLIERKDNGMIKVITGIRRCGKSYLLFTIFKRYLLENGVDADHIIEIALDGIENEELRDPKVCFKYIKDAMKYDGKYYLLLDEVQFMPRFEEVLNSLLRMSNIDVYVTGSNSKFLSSDIVTEFRGRGDEIRIYPLSFAEFYSVLPHPVLRRLLVPSGQNLYRPEGAAAGRRVRRSGGCYRSGTGRYPCR